MPLILTTAGGRLPTVTVTELSPAVLPSVHVPIGVGEPEIVLVGASGSVQPPALTATVILTPPRMLPFASFTEKVGAGVTGKPAVASAVVANVGAIDAGFGGDVESLQPNAAATTTKKIDRAEFDDFRFMGPRLTLLGSVSIPETLLASHLFFSSP